MAKAHQLWGTARIGRGMRKVLAACLCSLMFVTMGACSSSSDSSKEDAEKVNGSNAPVTNLTWAIPTPVTSLTYLGGAYVIYNLLEGLVTADGQGRLKPGLATSWTRPSPTTYVFTLRDGVQFWDGAPMTPADVVWSVERSIDPKNEPVFSGQLAGIKSVAETGATKVTIELKAADSAFLSKFVPVMIMQKKFSMAAGDNLGSPKVGVMATGPYKVGSLSPTGDTVIVRNEDYWGPKPTVRQVTYRAIADPDTLRLALEAGEVDGSFNYPLTGPSSKAFNNTYAPGPQNSFLILDTTAAPFNDVHARRAIAYLVDRSGIAKALYNGHATSLRSANQSSLYGNAASAAEVKDYFNSLPELKLDVEKAKEELGKSATPEGFSLEVEVPPTTISPLQQIMETIAANAKPLGINITVKPVTTAMWQQVVLGKSAKMVALTTGSAYVAPLGLFSQLISPTDAKAADGTFGMWAPADVRKLLADGAAATPDRQWAMSKEIMTKMSDEMPFVPIVNPAFPLALSKKYVFEGGFQPYSTLFVGWASHIRAAS